MWSQSKIRFVTIGVTAVVVDVYAVLRFVFFRSLLLFLVLLIFLVFSRLFSFSRFFSFFLALMRH